MSFNEKALILDKAGIERALTRVAHEILEKNKGAKDLVLVGIQRGGVHLAKRLAAKIKDIEGVAHHVPGRLGDPQVPAGAAGHGYRFRYPGQDHGARG